MSKYGLSAHKNISGIAPSIEAVASMKKPMKNKKSAFTDSLMKKKKKGMKNC